MTKGFFLRITNTSKKNENQKNNVDELIEMIEPVEALMVELDNNDIAHEPFNVYP